MISIENTNELRDALSRRQKELPPRWLAALDATDLRDGAQRIPGHDLEAVEREMALTLFRDSLPDARPRGIVCLRPSGSAATDALVNALCDRGAVTSIVAAELDPKLAEKMLERIAPAGLRQSSTAIACDLTIDLPLPDRLPRPRVYLGLGNVLGSTTTVGAVRLLRVLRSTMSPGDSIVLGLDVPRTASAEQAPRLEASDVASRHFRALELVNAAVGAGFDPGRFEFRPMFDPDSRRLETHLVARRAFDVAVPGVGNVRFRKGESIRTSVRDTFDRNRVSAMMAGVGLELREWTTDPATQFVVALANPAA